MARMAIPAIRTMRDASHTSRSIKEGFTRLTDWGGREAECTSKRVNMSVERDCECEYQHSGIT